VKGDPPTGASVPSAATEKIEISPEVLLALFVTNRKFPRFASAMETGLEPTAYGEPLMSVSAPVVAFSARAESVPDV
jgi:hypothetical protein